MTRLISVAALLLAVGGSQGVLAQMPHHLPGGGAVRPTDNGREGAPLIPGLGDHTHKVSTRSPEAQKYFDQGLTLAFAFNHAEAVRSFKEAARRDPQCAMAWWGVAYALGPNINAPMEEAAAKEAWAAIQKAKDLMEEASEKERQYILAMEKRYSADPKSEREPHDRAWSEAMAEVVRRYPADLDARTIYAESIMDTRPWNYWTEDLKPQPGTSEVLANLEHVLERNPKHPGANHLYIHAVEAGPEPKLGLASADRLRDLCPAAGHLVHMPAHIYLRLGLYNESVVANQKAIEADERYIAACNAQGFYPAAYHSHNIHFLWYALAMEGRSTEAIEAARNTASVLSDETVRGISVLEWLRATPMFAYVRFGMWDAILAEPEPPEDFSFLKAMRHYARGLAFAARDDLRSAEEELAALETVAAREGLAELIEVPSFYGMSQIEIARLVLSAAISGQSGDESGMIELLREATARQDALPYMEPPYWYYPVRQSLGAALLRAGRPEEAEREYRKDLRVHPHNGWALYGLRQALRAQGREDAANEVDRQLELAWVRADVPPGARPF